MNLYHKAIERKETKQFLLGKRNYFYLDRDWGVHNPRQTAYVMLEYAHLYGEIKLYQQLNEDLFEALCDDLIELDDLLILINYIWIYFDYKQRGMYQTNWNVSHEVKQQIARQIALKSGEHQDMSNVNSMIDGLRRKYNFSLEL